MDIGGIVYPLFLVCVIFGIMMLIAIGSSYLWLVVLDAEGRMCPNCRRKKAGNLTTTEIIDSTSYRKWMRTREFGSAGTRKLRLVEITEKNYQDYYECQYCEHKWIKSGKEISRTLVASQNGRQGDGVRG
jgi:hypothetical protein